MMLIPLFSCLTRAIENECILAMTNVAGPTSLSKPIHEWTEDDAIAVGRSCVCAPFVGCVGKLESGDEGLLLANVDLRVLQDARQVYKCRQDIKKALCAEAEAK
jgi:predicted amidohydrolase